MKHALVLLSLSALLLVSLSLFAGFDRAYAVAYGSVTAMAASISLTFFLLWRARATPLALGMGFSWAGATGVMGWWWLHRLLGQPEFMERNVLLFLFVAAYGVGAALHFKVVARSLGVPVIVLLLPLAVAGLFSIG